MHRERPRVYYRQQAGNLLNTAEFVDKDFAAKLRKKADEYMRLADAMDEHSKRSTESTKDSNRA